MKLHLSTLMLGASLALTASGTTLNFNLASASAYYYFGTVSPCGGQCEPFTLAGPTGTLTGVGSFSDIGLVTGGAGTTVSFSVPFAADIINLSGSVTGEWCVGFANFSVPPVTLPAEASTNFVTTVPASFSGASGSVADNCSFITGPPSITINAYPSTGLEKLTFALVGKGAGWQLAEADYTPTPEPRTLALVCAALLFLALAKVLHRKITSQRITA